MTIIAANPGWCLLEPVWDNDNDNKIDYILFEPIIAWEIEPDCAYVTPITIEGNISSNTEAVILQRPDGTITEIEGMIKMTIEDVHDRFMELRKS